MWRIRSIRPRTSWAGPATSAGWRTSSTDVAGPAHDVLGRIDRILHIHGAGGMRHQLHEPDGTRARDGGRVARALRPDHRAHQLRRDVVERGGAVDLVRGGIRLPPAPAPAALRRGKA